MQKPADRNLDARSDEELVLLSLAGDELAFPVLIQRYWRMVFSLAYKNCRNVIDSEDVTQESFLAALGSLHKLKDPSKFSSWLYGLALNTGRSFLRKKARTPVMPEALYDGPDDSASTLEDMTQDERSDALLKAVDSLKPIYRIVIQLRYIEGLSCEDISKRLGEPSGTVRSRLCRATDMLRRKLKKFEPNEMR